MLRQTTAHKTGVLIIGLSGNNGSTFLATHILHKRKEMSQMFGSLASVGTLPVYQHKHGERPIVQTFRDIIPSLLTPHEMIVEGWDIRNLTMEEAMHAANVVPSLDDPRYKRRSQQNNPKKVTILSFFYRGEPTCNSC